MWDERYATAGYLFGKRPAQFLVDQKANLEHEARALAVADGEGRNSVYMAEQGLDVVAMDGSPVAVEKAKKLAAERGVAVDFRVADIFAWDWKPEAYDLVVAIFIQFMGPADRKRVFEGMVRTLRPGGTLLLHGYGPEQLAYGTGGPPHEANMYTEALLRDAFGAMDVIRLASYDRAVDEGRGHSGMSALIDLVARKR